MGLSAFNNKCVRIVDESGDKYDGVCRWHPASPLFQTFALNQESLQIDDRLFYLSNIRTVRELPGPPELWKNLPQHCMRLAPEPFESIRQDRKTVELRLWDEKRRRLKIGDVIRFERADDGAKVLRVRVTELLRFPSFAGLYRAVPPEEMGYAPDDPASPEDMSVFYSPEQQTRWGVVGIRFERL